MRDEAAALRATANDLERRLEREPTPRVHAPLAEALRLLGDHEGALRVAREGVDRFPDHAGIRIALARALSDAGAPDEATEAYRQVARLDPDNLEAAAALGAPRPESAAAAVEAERAPATEETGDLALELAHLAELFTPSPDPDASADETIGDGIATLTLAEIYARQGLAWKAVEVCETVVARNPDNDEARTRLEEYRRMLAAVG